MYNKKTLEKNRKFNMKKKWIGIAVLLILSGAFLALWLHSGAAGETARSDGEALRSPVATFAEPETDEPETEEPETVPEETIPPIILPDEPPVPDPGLSSLGMELSGKLYATPDHPKVRLKVTFSGELGLSREACEPCVLECRRDGVLVRRVENYYPTDGKTRKFTIPYAFSRYMTVHPSVLTVTLRRGSEVLTAEAVVDVQNDPEEVWVRKSGDPRPYSIDVLRSQNVVVIYGRDDDGNYTLPVKVFACSTGRATPRGDYTLGPKKTWGALFGGVYGQYASRITGNILFHSVPYYSMHKNDLETEEYNKLGTAASMGCVRLPVRDAKWIFDYCPVGTAVHIYDVDVLPVERPDHIYIDPSSPYAGWDPTDPDPNNPWNQ